MPDQPQLAKRYAAIHNLLFIVDTGLTLGLLIAFLLTGGSVGLADWVRSRSANPWLQVTLFGAIFVVGAKLIFLPLSWFGGYFLEHRYQLSNETFAGWVLDEVKSLGVNLVLGAAALDVIYFLLRSAGPAWWLWAGLFLLVFGVVLSALFPVVILPFFYKLEPLENAALRQRLVGLADRVDARVLGVYRLALSAKTKKANAAFAGLGATKRVLLGDTLLNNFTEDEIEVVMAHEMAHYKHGDIWKMMGWGAGTTWVGLWLADAGLRRGLHHFGFLDVSDLGAFPLLALGLAGFGLVVLPVNNAFSRWRERKADQVALELTRNPMGFASAMRKLATQNLADADPHPVIEFLLHDHPALNRRIALAEQWQPN